MKIFVPKESRAGEMRVALVPDVISKLTRAGFEVAIESGAGLGAGAGDKDFVSAGARVVGAND
ncbi:MAG: NAD(P)(+) transhydrogenase (Re/Si-specific) subunit alpha, partial [Actinomycetota bacterium]